MITLTSLLNRDNLNADSSGQWKSEAYQVLYRYSDIDLAMKGAADFKIPDHLNERIAILKKGYALLKANTQKILETIQLEQGRTNDDVTIEWSQVERFCSELFSDPSLNIENTEARGISILLGTSAWPLFYTVHFLFLNFLAGNSLILKPSEKVTLSVSTIVQILRELPELKSVQVVVGEKEVGRRLATHEAVSTILFQGSFEVGMRVKQDALSQPSKEVLLYLGSKNPAVVFADAKSNTEEALIRDAFLGTGQHCRNISLMFIERARLAAFTEKFHALSKTFKIGGPQTDSFMGPLGDANLLDRYHKFVGISEREGAEIIMRGKPFAAAEKGHFVTPTIAVFESVTPDQLRKSISLQTEILAPHVSVIGFDTEEELLVLLNGLNHGRIASLWTEDTTRAVRIGKTLAVGEVIVNQSVFQSNPYLTTQARKRSGNHALLGQGLVSQLVFLKSLTV